MCGRKKGARAAFCWVSGCTRLLGLRRPSGKGRGTSVLDLPAVLSFPGCACVGSYSWVNALIVLWAGLSFTRTPSVLMDFGELANAEFESFAKRCTTGMMYIRLVREIIVPCACRVQVRFVLRRKLARLRVCWTFGIL